MPEAAYRAATPAVAAPTRPQERKAAALRAQHLAAEPVERQRQLRGMVWLAVLLLGASIARAGVGSVFPQGWWRIW